MGIEGGGRLFIPGMDDAARGRRQAFSLRQDYGDRGRRQAFFPRNG
jgi:hypothetical protein